MIRLFFSHTGCTRALTLAAVAGTLLLSLGTGARAEGEATPEQQERVETVVNRLVTAIKTHPAEYTWPPIVKVTKDAGTDNADAGLYGTEKDTGLSITMVRVSPSLLTDIVKDDDDTMAFILGHELSHCLHKDSQMRPELTQTNYLFQTFTRQQEYDADKSGMKMALAAGYSFKRALGGPREFIAQGHDYSSFEATSVDHPSWRDRIAALDKDQESLWRSMSAFENGQYFLTVEQYESAGRCFTGVTESFPDCSEAWSNLGYAKLMQYCDGLKTADIRRMGLGQIVVGGFYQRPRSLELKVRGTNPHPWNEAVVALQQALKLNPQLTLAKANLALAYLVAPEGRDPARAAKLFQEAATMAAADMAIDPFTRAAVLVNAGVADIARGQMVAGRLNIDRGERAAAALAGPGPAAASTLSDAVLYNRALLLADSKSAPDQDEAMAGMEKYLHSASPASAWWPLAFERYTALCKARGTAPQAESALRSAAGSRMRPLNSLEIIPGKPLTIADPLRKVVAMLGESAPIPLVPDTNLVQMNYPARGVSVIATNVVLALRLSGPNAPALAVRGVGLGAETTSLQIGMTKDQLESAVKENYEFTQIVDPEVNYRFYRSLGLAVLVRGGVVKEMMIVQVPSQS